MHMRGSQHAGNIMQPISRSQGWSPRAAEPPTTPQFFELAGEEKNLTPLILLFHSAMTIVDANDHHCSRLVMHHHVVPLFGNAPGHRSEEPTYEIQSLLRT